MSHATNAVAERAASRPQTAETISNRRPSRWKPGDPLPRRCDRWTAAEIVSFDYFPTTQRAVRDWPLEVVRINGVATVEVKALIAEAERRLKAAPRYKSGKA